jgi:hypothetical protein
VSYTEDDIRKALATEEPLINWDRKTEDEILDAAVAALCEGKVVGWYQEGSELGPRALGHRSILADARNPRMKDILNERVKHREAFRPFGPIVLAERVQDIVDCKGTRPFMLHVDPVKPEWRERIPAAVHVDNTTRVQGVTQESNPRLYALLRRFEAQTGVPVLLNTSLNVAGEPLVERPEEAIEMLRRNELDVLVIDDFVCYRRALQFDSVDIRALRPYWKTSCVTIQEPNGAAGDHPSLRTRRAILHRRQLKPLNLSEAATAVLDRVDGQSTLESLLNQDHNNGIREILGEYMRLGFLGLTRD